ncbi:AAA family ATPase [Desulfovulcanus sp.]
MYYPRYYDARLVKEKNGLLKPGRVLVVYGPRRAGKTTLLQRYIQNFEGKVFYGIGEDRILQDIFASQSVARISSAFTGYDLIVIDEAQAIDKIGLRLK